MSREEIFALIKKGRPQDQILRIQGAYWFAEIAHGEEVRNDGTPAIGHPERVVRSLIEHGYTSTHELILGLLHDVPEDGKKPLPPHVIIKSFGARVWYDLRILSKTVPVFDRITGAFVRHTPKPPQQRYFGGIAKARPSVRRVKLADRLDNLLTCRAWDLERRRRYAVETYKFILPWAKTVNPSLAEKIEAATKAIDPGEIPDFG